MILPAVLYTIFATADTAANGVSFNVYREAVLSSLEQRLIPCKDDAQT